MSSIDIRGRDAEQWSRRSSQLPTATSRAGGRTGFTANAAGAQVAARLHAAWTSSGTVRQATIGLLVALAYYAGARLGFLLVFPGSPLSVIWPPNAIVLAALLLVPPRAWWIVLLGVLPAHLVVEWQSGVMPLAMPGLYVTNCGEALLGATIVRRLSGGGPPWLGTLQQVVVYVVGAAIAAPFVASFLDASVVEVTHWAAPGEYWLLWEQRFISAVLTNLTVAPVILLLACGGWRQCRTLPRRRGVEAALLALSILGSSYLAFSPRTVLPRDTPELLYLLVPVLLWAAVRFGVGGISTSLLAVALLASGWADASGLFVARAPAAAVVTLQLFLIALGAPALCLAGLVKEREGARAEAERQAAQLDRIFEGMAEGLVVHDAQGLTVRTNASARRLLGLDAAPPGYNHMPLPERIALYQMRDGQERPVAPEDTPSARALRGEVVTGPQAQDLQLRTLDGRDIEVNSSAAPLLDREGRLVGAVNILRDQTERNQLEREREAARAKELATREVNQRMEEFLATAAHDVRTPLSAVTGYVALAQGRLDRLAAAAREESPPLAQQIEALRPPLEEADQGAERLSRLVAVLFDTAALRTGTLELRRAPCDLAELVREQVEGLRVAASQRTIHLQVEAETQPLLVEADATRVGQVIANYLTNALKYSTTDQPVEVTVQMCREAVGTAADEGGRALARVAVRDAGPGLPKAEQARVWEPFHRVPGVTAYGGAVGSTSLGLGLHICKAIVEAHGGQVGVESEVGRGSTFWFALPLADPESHTYNAPCELRDVVPPPDLYSECVQPSCRTLDCS